MVDNFLEHSIEANVVSAVGRGRYAKRERTVLCECPAMVQNAPVGLRNGVMRFVHYEGAKVWL